MTMEPGTTASSPNLNSMTVAQLRALCKERHITGYSKLAKPALIQKLSSLTISPVPTSSNSVTLPVNESTASAPQAGKPQVKPVSAKRKDPPPNTDKPKAAKKVKTSNQSTGLSHPSNLNAAGLSVGTSSSLHLSQPENPSNPGSISKNAEALSDQRLDAEQGLPLPKSSAIIPSSNALTAPAAVLSKSTNSDLRVSSTAITAPKGPKTGNESAFGILPTPLVISKPAPSATGSSFRPLSSETTDVQPTVNTPFKNLSHFSLTRSLSDNITNAHTVNLLTSTDSCAKVGGAQVSQLPYVDKVNEPMQVFKQPGKRFKPLLVQKNNDTKSIGTAKVPAKLPPPRLYYLDFLESTADSITLSSIALPPPIAQRKFLPLFTIALLHVNSPGDLLRCTFVSKMFRYAVYLSARERLKRKFSGRRFEAVWKKWGGEKGRMNFWPYLRAREEEVAFRRNIYQSSFLHQAVVGLGARDVISERVWASPDFERQATVAVRFVLSRVWFLLSISSNGQGAFPVIVDIEPAVPGQVWLVTTSLLSKVERFYVLEATCEVIGHPPIDNAPFPKPTSALRMDWSIYVESYLLSSKQELYPSLLSLLKWEGEDYDAGISRVWTERICSEADKDFVQVKQVISKRYILASVLGGGLSGRWMSASHQAAEFAGLGDEQLVRKRGKQVVNLYLPPHHNLESVHLHTSSHLPLHQALAIVHTMGDKEYYVLRDNGMVVGSSPGEGDDAGGVKKIWRDLIGCDERGLPQQQA